MRRLIPIALALATIAASPTLADDHAEHIPTLTVSGTAIVTAAPDQAKVRLAVITEDEDATDAARDNAALTTEVIRALVKAGANQNDIETSGFSVEPQYNYGAKSQNRPPKIVGYRVSNEVLVSTLELGKAGDLIGAGIEAGANRVNSLQFTLRDNTAQRAEAIALATAAAKADATALADAAGVSLSGVHRIDLVPTHIQPVHRSMGRSAVALESAAPPINPGDIEVKAQVNIVYEIEG